MAWRYYVQRAGSGLWLDTDARISQLELGWSLSASNFGTGLIPRGLFPSSDAYYGEDGRPVWGKMDTILYAEEDDQLAWAGICTAATPSAAGLQLEFTGPFGWASNVPYTGRYSVWQTNTAEVVRHFIAHAVAKPVSIPWLPQGPNELSTTVGDAQPPDKPKEPPRRKGETKSEWQSSDRYNKYQDELEEWNKKYGDREKFEVAYWDAPYVGDEIDDLRNETGFEFREKVRWLDRGALTPAFYFEYADDLRNRRDDITFENGVNISKALDPKAGDENFANNIIALGAGEGRKMRRVSVSEQDGRLHQGIYVQYKYVKNMRRLRALAARDLTSHAGKGPRLDAVTIRDSDGNAAISSLRCGDEVEIISDQDYPAIQVWARILEITRRPSDSSSATIAVETL